MATAMFTHPKGEAHREARPARRAHQHFDSCEELPYAAAVCALGQITTLAGSLDEGGAGAYGIASAYLQPEMRQNRRLIAELHVASVRDASLAKLLASVTTTTCPPSTPRPTTWRPTQKQPSLDSRSLSN